MDLDSVVFSDGSTDPLGPLLFLNSSVLSIAIASK